MEDRRATCASCNGLGIVNWTMGYNIAPDCEGEKCARCDGTGYILEKSAEPADGSEALNGSMPDQTEI